MHILLNSSSKKSATTFLYDLFLANRNSLPQLAIPPVKEWYLFPRKNENYVRFLTTTAIEKSNRERDNPSIFFQKEDALFCRMIAEEQPLRLRLSGIKDNSAPSNHIHESVDRIIRLSKIYPEDSNLLVSDPNFLDAFVSFSKEIQQFVVEKLNSAGIKFTCFSILRHPAESALSLTLMKMITDENKDLFEKDVLSRSLARQCSLLKLPYLVTSGLCEKVLLIDFTYFVKNPGDSANVILKYGGLKPLSEINIPINPNPGSHNFSKTLINQVKEDLSIMYNDLPKELRRIYSLIAEKEQLLFEMNGLNSTFKAFV